VRAHQFGGTSDGDKNIIVAVPSVKLIQAHLSEPAMTWVRAEAERLGIGPSELLRRIVDAVRLPALRQGDTTPPKDQDRGARA
jgi:hypothetical protein